MKLIIISLSLLFTITSFGGGTCTSSFVKKSSLRYTESLFEGSLDNHTKIDILGKGGNGEVYLVQSENQKLHFLSYKTFINRHARTTGLKVNEVNAEKNLVGDLVRYKFYDDLISKTDLNFRTVRRYAAKNENLLMELIKGIGLFTLLRTEQTKLVEDYNKLTVSIMEKTLDHLFVVGAKITYFDILRTDSTGTARKVKLSSFLDLDMQLSLIDTKGDPLSIRINVEYPGGLKTYHALTPDNFLYSITEKQFIMIDPR